VRAFVNGLWILLGVVTFYIAYFIWMKYRANLAASPRWLEVPLPPRETAAVAANACGNWLQRKAGPPPVSIESDGSYLWYMTSSAGRVVFRVAELERGRGSRIESWADEIVIAQVSGRGAMPLAVALTNSFYRATGMPKKPATLLRQRRRALRAVAHAAHATA
jgi:hypothetical protein